MSEKQLRIGIVTIGYNRTDCLSRLLNRLNACDYPPEDVPLVISLDNCGRDDVYNFAGAFCWQHGTKTVLHQPQRLGLRNHILKCGSYIEQFDWDAAIILEDDVYPAAPFYLYARQAVEFYQNDDRIAGIALYALTQNQAVREPFFAAYSEYDAYFAQLAQSLGQVWMRRQWKSFADWYSAHSEPFTECPGVPDKMCRWPDTSWLKYHIRYCVEENKYFVYPHQSLTTNFGDVGTHTGTKSLALQTPLQQKAKERYAFPRLGEGGTMYDAWCENLALCEHLGMSRDEVCIDIYGAKGNRAHCRYWLTSRSAPYRIVRSFGMELRPVDMNVLCDLPGEAVFLYDTSCEGPAPAVPDRDIAVWEYNNQILFTDETVWKLAKPMRKRVWRSRWKLLLHPGKLLRKIRSAL